jgi:hypothetical protein
MREFLPVSDKFNHVTIRNRALRVGARIEKVGQSATAMPLAGARKECTIAIDGGFIGGTGKANTRNFEVLTGRLAAPVVKLRLCLSTQRGALDDGSCCCPGAGADRGSSAAALLDHRWRERNPEHPPTAPVFREAHPRLVSHFHACSLLGADHRWLVGAVGQRQRTKRGAGMCRAPTSMLQ